MRSPLSNRGIALIVVLLVYVVPQIVAVYEQSRQTLPWLTRALIATSGFLRGTAWMWLTGVAAVIVAWVVLNRSEAFRARWQRALLRVPVIGRLVVAVDTARFASTLAILTGSGAPLLRSLDLAGVESQGYCFQVDMTYRAVLAGARIVEVPITFVERELGVSKMSGSIIREALVKVTVWGVERRCRQLTGREKRV